VGEVVPSQTARLTTARLRMTEVIAAVPEKDDGSASAHVVPVSAPGVRLRRFVSHILRLRCPAALEQTGIHPILIPVHPTVGSLNAVLCLGNHS
jgi:hypothetical protein